MPLIRLPKDDWGKTWRLLIAEGGTTRTSKDHIYMVSDRQLKLLQEKQLPFEVLDDQSHSIRGLSSPTV